MNKKILVALDLGTKTGIATFGLDGQLIERSTAQFDRGSQAQNLFNLLRGFLTPNMVVAWEEPFGNYGQHVMQRLAGAVQCACELIGCDDVPMNVVTIKKFATGYGLASKETMIKFAAKKWGGFLSEWDEHQADACWIGQAAQELVLDPQTTKESNVK